MNDINPEVFCNSKWQLVKEIAAKHQSPTELAEKLGTSLSNITQQLKLLEAYDIVKKQKTDETGNSGKPKSIYSISNEFAYTILISDGKAEKKYFKLEGLPKTIFSTMLTVNSDDIAFMIKFQVKHEEILKKCKAIGFLKSLKDSIELFLITDHVDEIRSKFSNIFLDDGFGKTKKIVNWTHNEYEINDGLNRKDKYYMEMIKNIQIIHDPQGIMRSFKEQRKNIQ